MSDDVVALQNVCVDYNGTPILEDVSLVVRQDDFLGIIGPNGGGKTTLLKVILGLVKPNRGKVLVLDKPPQESRRLVGYVAQHGLFDHDFPIDVWNVVLMGAYSRRGLVRRFTDYDASAAEEALRTVGMLDFKRRQIGKLSGGEQQRVFIARALVTEPKLLLLDEPTASVDPAMQTEFYELLRTLKQRMAIVLVSHDIGAVSVYVDEIACLNRRLFYHGSKEIGADILQQTYSCPIAMIAHGAVPHRVLMDH